MSDTTRYLCPKCGSEELIEEVTFMAVGWRPLDGFNQVPYDAAASEPLVNVEPTGDVACGSCQWSGSDDALVEEPA